MQFIYDNIILIEYLAAALGVFAVWLQIKENIYLWLVNIITSLLYMFVFFESRLYADLFLQSYYIFMCIYGWYSWFGNNNKKNNKLKKEDKKFIVKRINKLTFILSILAVILLFILISFFLKNFTNSDVVYWNSLTTALGFVATWLLAKKILENWLFWLIANILSFSLYFSKHLYPTTMLYILLTILSWRGFVAWRKDLIAKK